MKHPGRKLYHVIGGTGLLSLFYLFGREQALVIYVILFCVALGLDIMRLALPDMNIRVFAHFHNFIRASERHHLTGTSFYIFGIGLSFLVYSPSVAATAVCFLIFGDVAATTIGERYGKTRIGDKSLEGTAAFVLAAGAAGSALSVVGLGVPAGAMALGALVAAGFELLALPVNDNLIIPVVSGGVMEYLLHGISSV